MVFGCLLTAVSAGYQYDCTEPDMFHCADGNGCFPIDHYCDDHDHPDCEDRSDEPANCTCKVANMFLCDGECRTKNQLCNGQRDCIDYADERDCCNVLEKEEKFSCKDGTACIKKTLVCDNKNNCRDRSDESEELCGTTAGYQYDCTEPDMFHCADGNGCFPIDHYCDDHDHPDCEDRSDEPANCTCKVANMFLCDGECRTKNQLCNGQRDCIDYADERDCCHISINIL
ncbi:very low-density lipoprotein receptor-like [Ptychodera flava]|uniref:very low-density lipoprotein receptor-like n=1 Tax=Ptychodera flava TaxID=63121 RepID=UPI00396A70F7